MRKAAFLSVMVLILHVSVICAQDYRISVYINPLISWFRSNSSDLKNVGSRAGFNINLSGEKYLSEKFAVKAGLSMINTAGRLKTNEPVSYIFHNFTAEVAAGAPVTYHLNYLSLPLGIKYKTNEYGPLNYFGEAGFDPRIVIRGRVDIPSLDIYNQRAMTEIKAFNIGYHINGGIDYSLSEKVSFVLGLGFENNFLDITKDLGGQTIERTSQRLLKFIFGINIAYH
jgi:hypothetical protein